MPSRNKIAPRWMSLDFGSGDAWQHQTITWANVDPDLCQSINQSNPVLLKERVRIPRTRRAGGAAMLWGRLPLDGVGSCRLFFTDDLHDNLSWVPASDKPHTFKSYFTHSSQVFFGRPGPFLPGTGLNLTLFISPLERMTCPNQPTLPNQNGKVAYP